MSAHVVLLLAVKQALALAVVIEVKQFLLLPSLRTAVLEVVHDTNSMSLHRCALALLEQCHEWDEHELSVRKEAQGRLEGLVK